LVVSTIVPDLKEAIDQDKGEITALIEWVLSNDVTRSSGLGGSGRRLGKEKTILDR
jgi:hypothetical protein